MAREIGTLADDVAKCTDNQAHRSAVSEVQMLPMSRPDSCLSFTLNFAVRCSVACGVSLSERENVIVTTFYNHIICRVKDSRVQLLVICLPN